MRAKVPPFKTKEGLCGPCNKSRCEICKHITFLLAKPAINNTHEVLKKFGVDLLITDVRKGTF